MTSPQRTRILFLCTGNSARSLLAEAIARHRHVQDLEPASAGSRPRGEPHPLALETLTRRGVPVGGLTSKHVESLQHLPFDVVITLCASAANEPCPNFASSLDDQAKPVRAHWGFPDPPEADDPAAMFDAVYDDLVDALDLFIAGQGTLPQRADDVAQMIKSNWPHA